MNYLPCALLILRIHIDKYYSTHKQEHVKGQSQSHRLACALHEFGKSPHELLAILHTLLNLCVRHVLAADGFLIGRKCEDGTGPLLRLDSKCTLYYLSYLGGDESWCLANGNIMKLVSFVVFCSCWSFWWRWVSACCVSFDRRGVHSPNKNCCLHDGTLIRYVIVLKQ